MFADLRFCDECYAVLESVLHIKQWKERLTFDLVTGTLHSLVLISRKRKHRDRAIPSTKRKCK